jgi:glycosyltransferase involved in cell wall biosynthesis
VAKIKIAFDANPLVGNKTGVGQLTEELIIRLASNNPENLFVGQYFDFLNRKQPSNLPVAENITYKKTTLMSPKLINLLRRASISFPFEFFCRIRPNIILSTNFVSSPSLFSARNVLFVYDLCYEDFPEFVSDKNGNYLRKWVPKSIKRADKIVTISEFTKSRITDLYKVSPEKITVMSVPPRHKSDPDSSILKRLDLRDYLLFVGTLEPRKNILNLLRAYELLPKDMQDKYPLVLVGGKGWKDEGIIQKIVDMQKANLRIIQTGYVSDAEKSALYESSTLVSQLSHYEGFGMPVLEAMNYGKPVVCSDIEVFHEIAGDAVVYTDKDSPEDIMKSVSVLLNDQGSMNELSEKATKNITNYPSWDEVAKHLTKELKL